MARRTWNCLGCKLNLLRAEEYYMVHDHIWEYVNPKIDGMLCIGCVESRLGRRLCPHDFTDAPVNQLDHPGYKSSRSMRLFSRLLGFNWPPKPS